MPERTTQNAQTLLSPRVPRDTEHERYHPELEEAIQEALHCGHGYVIDCAIDMDEMVRPMVPGGGQITDFLVC